MTEEIEAHALLPSPLTPTPYVSRAGAGETVTLQGVAVTFLAESSQTGGAWSLIGYDAPPGFVAAPPHRHERTTEMFYVLDGALTVQLGDERVRAARGTCVIVPPGVRHTFGNPDAERARFLAFASPGGHDVFIRELLSLIAQAPAWPPEDPTALHALSRRFDTMYDAP